MKSALRILLWLAVAILGAVAYSAIAFHEGEHLNSSYILIAAVCTYTLGYRFYSKWIAARVLMLNDARATPCEMREDGRDYVRTNKWIVFGHHFAAISGPGPLVGPVLAAQFGYLPGTLWILIGAVFGGAVQDFVILVFSMRRNGKSLGQMVKEELNSFAGALALIAILTIIVILLAVLGLVIVRALAESPWGAFTVAATIPIAMFMGSYFRWFRIGKVMEISVIGAVLLLLAVWGGQFVHSHEDFSKALTFKAEGLAWSLIIYGLLASILPIWLLLAPRDYLSTFMKLGTILALALGVVLVLPSLQMPAITQFIDGTGLVVPGELFPFCFITIACGAISGFHTLIASGTTPKMITRESASRSIGFGAMCLESLVAIMAMIAACTLDPGVYLAINVKGTGATPAALATSTLAKVNEQGAIFHVDAAQMDALATQMGETSLYGRTGGAATLAVGMAQIFSRVTHGRGVDLWYHFAVMFEALFILTTLDAGTRVGRYLLQDALGHFWKPLGDTNRTWANIFASTLIVSSWGYFLIQGVRDPLGGINSLWPLFGIANQLLAAIALCLATTILLKMALQPQPDGKTVSLWRCLITFLPLAWLVAVTFTAGWQKIADNDPRIGFLAAARVLDHKMPVLTTAAQTAKQRGDLAATDVAKKALDANRAQHFNNCLDAFVASFFLVLVTLIVAVSMREWILLALRKKLASLSETDPQWLSLEPKQSSLSTAQTLGIIALSLALLREISGQSAIDREAILLCNCKKTELSVRSIRQNAYLSVNQRRFNTPSRCC